mgnify:CR=1 FL=1
MDGINITSAQHVYDAALNQNVCIKATIEGVEVFVPLAAGNTDYDEIMRQVNAGTLTIQDAD